MRVNFRATPSGDFPPYPAGSYPLEVESMEMKKGGQSNENYIKTTFKHLTDTDELRNRKEWDNFSLQVQAGWKLKEFLEAGEIPHTAIPGNAKGEFEIDFDTQDAIGRRVIAQVSQETYVSNKLDESGNKISKIKNSIDKYLKP